MIAAREVLQRAEQRREETFEIEGYLSEQFGLLPYHPPRTELPPSHSAWDEMAAQLPELFRSVAGREALDEMPILPADEDSLPTWALWRASSLLGHFAHSYVRVRPDPPSSMPPSITQPWTDVCRRMHRSINLMTYDDLICTNWRLRDPEGPRTLENMDVMTSTVGNREERMFYLIQVEAHARGAALVGAVVRAQEAVVAEDQEALERELAAMIDALDDATHQAFMKIDPNPYSPTHVDPVVWAKTVAPFAVGISEGVHAVSGASAPLFNVLDAFIGRSKYDSVVGQHEAHNIQVGFSPNYAAFLDAVREISVSEFVVRAGTPALRGLWQTLLETYAGKHGFLGVHRLKAYGFLELAFKVGRSQTTGGFSGLFEDQTWMTASQELEVSRQERWEGVPQFCPVVTPAGTTHDRLTAEGVAHLRIDVHDAGLRYHAGDRLSVLPEHDPELVAKTLLALGAAGDETIRLDATWRDGLAQRGFDPAPDELPLRRLLELARLRPVSRDVAKALLAYTESERLARIVESHAESAWELWDLLEMLAEGPFDPRELWRADPWDAHSICKIAPPELQRVYSVSSSMREDNGSAAESLELLAAELTYTTPESEVSHEALRHGTGSRFLSRLAHGSDPELRFPVRVVPASRFRLPQDATRPIVMFAGGAGLSAFRGFVQDRMAAQEAGEAWLLLSTRSDRHAELYRKDFKQAIDAGRLRLDTVVTAVAHTGQGGISELVADNRERISELLGDDRTVFYICGPVGFAVSVIEALEQVAGAEEITRMIGQGRLLQDVFTAPQPEPGQEPEYDNSEIALHNDPEMGMWTIIDDRVYDLTRFSERHPGGVAIVREQSGRDATEAYRVIEHHLDPEIEALLSLYRIGHVRPVRFGRRGAVAVGPEGLKYVLLSEIHRAWVRHLHLVVEIENALVYERAILDDVTVEGDPVDRLTFLKAQLLLEAQTRFTAIYLPALIDRGLQDLWAMTTAICAPGLDARGLAHELEAVAARPESKAAREGPEKGEQALHALGLKEVAAREAELARLQRMRPLLEAANQEFVAGLKQAAIAGLRPYEEWGGEVVRRAGHTLLEPLRTVPSLVAGLDSAVAAAFATPTEYKR